ncbi:MAG TPA: [protein-PII] uridylyltransferase [Desulfobacteraceae bacterium]|nr:[protein-PII] uridylyltransferase [Desulfobacteraceae bacterium]
MSSKTKLEAGCMSPKHATAYNPDATPAARLIRDREALTARFLRGEEADLLQAHATLLDDYFRDRFEASRVGLHLNLVRNPYAIVALGGYGRGEQCVHSDVDLMLLFEAKVPAEAEDLVREVVYPLWDAGMEVGHATRSLRECLRLARQDHEVLTSLLDARFVCGQSRLYAMLTERLRQSVIRPKKAEIIRWLVSTNQARHRRFGDSSYLLEPNLKEGRGGLRDYHTMRWIARIQSNLHQRRDLEYAGYLTTDEYAAFDEALRFVWEVRNRLHHASGRKNDQLHFDQQVRIARAMHYSAADGQQPVERFLGRLHGHMEFIKEKHLMFLYDQGYGLRHRRSRSTPSSAPAGIEVVADRLAFAAPEQILAQPALLLHIFQQAARLHLPLGTEAKRLVREFLHLVDERTLSEPGNLRVFEQILLRPAPIFNVLSEMRRTGLLFRLIPELAAIRDRIQYDTYHLFPVDRHSLRVVRAIKGFGTAEDISGDPLCGELYKMLRQRKALLWAALLHDIGKGAPGGDHAARGAAIARRILGRIGYREKEIETVAFLVAEHLMLIKAATRRDINDEETALACARHIQDPVRLRMLYLLTVADSLSTGPKAWNEWTATLLRELFFKVLNILEGGELATGRAVSLVEAKRRQLLEDAADPADAEEMGRLIRFMSPRYLLYVPTADILVHAALYRRLGNADFVWDIAKPHGGATRTVTICAKDRPGLFSKIAGIFTLNGMNILGCQVYTWRNNLALDVFEVTPPPDPIFEDERWQRAESHLRHALAGRLDLTAALEEKIASWRPAQAAVDRRPPRVVVNNSASSFFTIIEVFAHDFPGLLYRVTDALLRCRLDIWVARVATNVDQVVDVFYVRDFDGQKVDRPDQVAAIEEIVMTVLYQGPEAPIPDPDALRKGDPTP